MPNAGYSGTPLIKKLGIKDDMKVQLINAPDNYFELIEKNISHQVSFIYLFHQKKNLKKK